MKATDEYFPTITHATRNNDNRPDYTLIDYKALEPMVRVLEFGANKYDRNNWKLGGPKVTKLKILASLQRHVGELIDAVNTGSHENDYESGLHLIGHIMCNTMFYSRLHVINNENEVKKE